MKRLEELFDIKNSQNIELMNCCQIENGICFVSRTSKNNGVSARVDKIFSLNPMPKGAITIALGGSVLSSFYQDEPFYTAFHIAALYPKQPLTIPQMIFYAYVIEQNKFRYNYGRQANRTLKNILIPDIHEIPDYVNNISISDYIFKKAPIIEKTIEFDTKNWKLFRYDDIFEIRKGKRLTKPEQKEGGIPYISSSSQNNGVDAYIGNGYTDENCISFACYGSIGEVFYQSDKVWISDNANAIYLKDYHLNKYIAMFLLTLLYKEVYRFSYGVTAKLERLKKLSIKLPISADGSPDWMYMEDYIKSLPYSKEI